MNRSLHLSTFFIGLALSTGAWSDKPTFNGFVSQAAIISNDNPFYDDEPDNNFNLREIGLTANWNVTKEIRLAGQALSRKAGSFNSSSPEIDFLLVDYNFWLSEHLSSGVRLGRVKNPYGLYNATRDVPHARPGVFVPRSVYFESFREALQRIDGGTVYLSNTSNLGDLNIDLSLGSTTIETTTVEYQVFQKDIVGEFKDVDVEGFKIEFIPATVRDLTLGFTWYNADMALQDAATFTPLEQFAGFMVLLGDPTQFTNYVTGFNIDAEMNLFSAQYSWNQWLFTGELLNIDINTTDIEVLHIPENDRQAKLRGYYLQSEWFASQRWSLYGRYEELFNNVDDKDGIGFAQRTGGNALTQYAKAFTLGARYYLTPDWSITGEFSNNEGAAFIAGTDDIDYSSLEKRWQLFILQMSYHF
ncbi:hypothetical protein [Aurantivibrio plasticivorans]